MSRLREQLLAGICGAFVAALALQIFCSWGNPMTPSNIVPQPLPSSASMGLVERLKHVEENIKQILRVAGAPGLSIGIVHGGSVVHEAHYGYRDLQTQLPPNSDTLYSINSMTKFFTAASLGILVDRGDVTWESPVKSLLADFTPQPAAIGERLTITDLLSHRHGFVTPDSFYVQSENEPMLHKSQTVAAFNYAGLRNAFRSSYTYSNFAYATAALVVEKVAKQPFAEFVQREILDPLDMKRTTSEVFDEESETNFAKAYATLFDGTPTRIPFPKFGAGTQIEGASGIKSCVSDLLHFYTALIKASNDQFSRKTNSTLGSPFKQLPYIMRGHNFIGGPYLREQTCALGWMRVQLPGVLCRQGINPGLVSSMPEVGEGSPSRLAYYHHGLMPGSMTMVYLFPETETVVLVLQNGSALNDDDDWIAQLLIESIFNMPSTHNFTDLAARSAQTGRAIMMNIHNELESRRERHTLPSLPLSAYTGRYHERKTGFLIEVTLDRDEKLQFAFQGKPSQLLQLTHYHHDTFSWAMSHDDAARRARLIPGFSSSYYLFRFAVEDSGEVRSLNWVIETTAPKEEVFWKESV